MLDLIKSNERIIELYRRWGLSAKELQSYYADLGDAKPLSAISRLRSGKAKPSIKDLLILAKETGTNIDYALSRTDRNEPDDTYEVRPNIDQLFSNVSLTLEEFEAVLTAFKEQDANGNGDPNDEIPMTFKFLGSQRDIGGFFGAFGYADTLAAGNTHIVVGEDGQLVFVPVTEGYKEGCKYLYEHFFAKGLIDQEGFTMDKKTYNSQNQGEIANIGVFMCWNSFDLGTVHEDEYEPLSPLLGPDGTTSWGTSPDSTMAATGFSISGWTPSMIRSSPCSATWAPSASTSRTTATAPMTISIRPKA